MGIWQFGSAALNLFRQLQPSSRPSAPLGRRSAPLRLEPLECRSLLTVSGFAYLDLNNNNVKDTGESGIPGVQIMLTGTDSANNALPTQTTTTGSDGSYTFSGLTAGTYAITEFQASSFDGGGATAGTLGGIASPNLVEEIPVANDTTNGTGYNFANSLHESSQITINQFLASSPTTATLLSNAIGAIKLVPLVSSITKTDPDPSNASQVHFQVTFNEAVTGVTQSDFSLVPSSGVTGISIASVTGSGTTYTVTVNTGSGSGTLALKLNDDDSIKDTAGTPLGGSDTDADFVSSPYTVNSFSVSITSVTSPVNLNNQAATAAVGTATAGANISVVATDGTHTTTPQTTTAASNGSWTVGNIDVTALNQGTITYTVTATDNQQHSATSSKTTNKDTIPPVILVTTVPDVVNSANQHTTSVTGQGDPGLAVSVTATDGTHTTTSVSGTVDQNGNFTINNIDVSSLNDGQITYTATTTDAAGNTKTSSKSTTKDTVAPTIAITTSPPQVNISNQHSVTISGTGTVGASVVVKATNGGTNATATAVTVDSGGNWSVTGFDISSVSDGTVTFTATITDTANNTALDTETANKDTVAPTVSLTTVTNPINIGNETTTSASGTGEVGVQVSVVASDGTNSTTPKAVTVPAGGNWTVDTIDVSTLNDGTITYTATATDVAGNTATSTLTAPKTTVAITSVTDPINNDTQDDTTASGTGQAGAAITLTVTDGTNTTTQQTTTVAGDGTWSIAHIDVSTLDDGAITYNVTATLNGHTSNGSLTTIKDTEAPDVAFTTVTDPVNNTNQTSATASGTTEGGASISLTVSDGTHTIGPLTATANGLGVWSITGIDLHTLTDGEITYSVTATDAAGNESTAVDKTANKDTQAPEVAITEGTTPITAANLTALSASGTGEVGAGISVVITDGTHTSPPQATTVGAGGTWTVSNLDATTLTDGTVTYVVTATDTAGNTATDDQEANKDATPPAVAITSSPNINIANQHSLTVSGTGEIGATIELTLGDGTHTFTPPTTTVDGTGNWSITGIETGSLDEGPITFDAKATDSVGNTAHSIVNGTKDLVAPLAEILTVTDPVTAANKTAVSATGTGEIGASATLKVSDGTHDVNVAAIVIGAGGTWSFGSVDVSTLDDGTITYTIVVTDIHGNPTTLTQTADKDTVVPEVTLDTVTNPVNASNVTDASASGTGTVGANVSLSITDGTHTITPPATSVGAGGSWSITGIDLHTLNDGALVYTVTVSDTVGNSDTATLPAIKDTVVPEVAITSVTSPITIANAAITSINGTGTAGDHVSVSVSDGTHTVNPAGFVTVDGTGHWVINNIDVSTLNDGTLTYTVTETDAGNNTDTANTTSTKTAVAITLANDPINAANQASYAVQGTGQLGAHITVTISDGTTTVTQTTDVDGTGNWSVTANVTTLVDGPVTITAAAKDDDDNTVQTQKQVTKDATPPELAITDHTASVVNGNVTNVEATVHTEAGLVVKFHATDGTHTTTPDLEQTADASGDASFSGLDVTTLDNGTITLVLIATDSAGNTTTKTQDISKGVTAP